MSNFGKSSGKRRSKQQKQHSHTLGKSNLSRTAGKENISPRIIAALEGTIATLEDQLTHSTAALNQQSVKSEALSREYKNMRRRTTRAERKHKSLKEELADAKHINSRLEFQNTRLLDDVQAADEARKTEATYLRKKNKALKMRVARTRASRLTAAEKANQRESKRHERFHLKNKGVVTDSTRALIRNLVKIGLSVGHVSAAIKEVANLLGVKLEGDIAPRSVRRIVLEGGIASEMQIVEEQKYTKSPLSYFNNIDITSNCVIHNRYNH